MFGGLIGRNWKPSKRGKDPFTGDCKIDRYSSLRKLERAMRRGKVPDERQAIMDMALVQAHKRVAKYVNSKARERVSGTPLGRGGF